MHLYRHVYTIYTHIDIHLCVCICTAVCIYITYKQQPFLNSQYNQCKLHQKKWDPTQFRNRGLDYVKLLWMVNAVKILSTESKEQKCFWKQNYSNWA